MDLKKEFDDLKKGQKELLQLIQSKESKKPLTSLKWLDLDGVCNYLPSKPAHATMYAWLSERKIPGHKRGNRWAFLVSEIDEWLKEGRQKTISEIEEDADAYLSNKK